LKSIHDCHNWRGLESSLFCMNIVFPHSRPSGWSDPRSVRDAPRPEPDSAFFPS
jgi:hypothetical protein